MGCHSAKILDNRCNMKGPCDKSVPVVFPSKAFPYKARHARNEIVEAVACAMALALATKLQKPRPERWPLQLIVAAALRFQRSRTDDGLLPASVADLKQIARASPPFREGARGATVPEQSFGLQPSQLRLEATNS